MEDGKIEVVSSQMNQLENETKMTQADETVVGSHMEMTANG